MRMERREKVPLPAPSRGKRAPPSPAASISLARQAGKMRRRLAKRVVARLALGWAALLLVGCASGRFAAQHLKGGPEIVEGGVIFRYYDPDAEKVYLVGDFNNWSPTADPMSDKNGDGEWTLFFPLPPGSYQYKFVVDGVYWIPDPRNPVSVPDGFGGRNSVISVPPRPHSSK